MENYKIIGIDLAKTKFHLAAINHEHRVVLKQKITRDDFLSKFLWALPQGQVFALEACGGCHYIAQKIQEKGHQVILLKTKDVKPYAKSRQKNDINDAIAICKAAVDPELMHVTPKTKRQQEVAHLHKMRKNTIKQRIQKTNGLMATLMEFGFVITLGKARFSKECHSLLQLAFNQGYVSKLLFDQMSLDCKEITCLLEREKSLDKAINEENKHSQTVQYLKTIPGVGPINASVLSIKPMEAYATPKDFSASLGLVPKQNSTGGITRLGPITKQGDRYARTMLIQAARTIVIRASKPNPPKDELYQFVIRLKQSGKPYNLICVAVANKIARIAYACVTKKIVYGHAA
jgi:transposase